ncbi:MULTISPECIES: hypothetical protein [Streptomyces]|uniref:hypothetical protein n=1 Tax=Streptomyces TaxID=1883 RepID=UPI001038B8F2|nr:MULTISPECIES: hypothetical protein [Streptomyces]MBT3077204.1 hypothetical protein [Streptomyces sp. COG21]MBT3082518.1 hypothetical protein [Streptomyces sp. COG20]MBT3087345.1 hypothetical protein [Streptomyces sp. CYG21]MBT3100759.1 hypothetical protein [Streptomyces sp. CBG30]MBT3104496.1 hypothetical protein [Streptomyces sp. COG19]
METAQQYETMGRRDFERKVAEESGSYGWETFSIFIIMLGGIGMALTVGSSDYSWLRKYLFTLSGLCIVWLAVRWRTHRR